MGWLSTKKNETKFLGAVLVLVWGLALFFRLPAQISHDPVWLLWVAEQVSAGRKLYFDIIIFNLPVIVWLKLPIIWLSELTGLNSEFCFKLFVFGLILLSLDISRRLMTRGKIPFILPQLIGLSLILLFGVAADFGQREHIFIILFLPYFYLVLIRSLNETAPFLSLILIAIMAATGICIKPHFLLFPFLLELFLLAKLRFKTFKRLEIYMMGALGLGIGAYIIFAMPDYLGKILPFTSIAYNGGIAQDYGFLLFVSLKSVAVAMMLILIALKNTSVPWLKHMFFMLLLMVVAGLLIYFVQRKGWKYQLFPAAAFSMLACFTYLMLVLSDLKSDQKRMVLSLPLMLGMGFVGLWYLYGPIQQLNYPSQRAAHWADSIKSFDEVSGVAIFTTRLSDPFPAVYGTANWSLSVPTMWMPLGIEGARQKLGFSTDRLDEVEAFSHDLMVQDFSKHKPDLVYVDEREEKPYFGETDLEYIEFYSRDPEFQKIWKRYKRVGDFRGYGIYRRMTSP